MTASRIEIGRAMLGNARDLEAELQWLVGIIDRRFQHYFAERDEPFPGATAPPPRATILGLPPCLGQSQAPYARLIAEHGFGPIERLALILALVPHLRPQLLDVFLTRNQATDRRFTEFGVVRPGGAEGEVWPTLDTVAFLLGGTALGPRFRLLGLLEPDHPFARLGLLRITPGPGPEPIGRAPLGIGEEWLHLFTLGQPRRPGTGGLPFPAQRLTSQLDWNDLVLHPATREQLDEIEAWLTHGPALMHDWGMARTLRPGYRALFHGPSGAGKTMTASLLGRVTGREAFRIDLAQVVSKYIGETEKSLSRLFDMAESKGWILFFDEADALFGKRGEVREAHDRFANQEVSYLLQRIETFDGVVILASNFRDNIDEAFARRFESIIYFPLPEPEERLRLWRQGLPPRARLGDDVDLAAIARDHELSGGAIMNAIRHASLHALREGGRPIQRPHLLQAIRREYAKSGRAG